MLYVSPCFKQLDGCGVLSKQFLRLFNLPPSLVKSPRCPGAKIAIKLTLQTRDIATMLVQCWPTVFDIGRTLNQPWVSVVFAGKLLSKATTQLVRCTDPMLVRFGPLSATRPSIGPTLSKCIVFAREAITAFFSREQSMPSALQRTTVYTYCVRCLHTDLALLYQDLQKDKLSYRYVLFNTCLALKFAILL